MQIKFIKFIKLVLNMFNSLFNRTLDFLLG